MGFFSHTSAFAQVTALASLRPVHGAFGWLHLNERKIMDWQAEMVAIPAPPFGEKARGEWLAGRLRRAGLGQARRVAGGAIRRCGPEQCADRRCRQCAGNIAAGGLAN